MWAVLAVLEDDPEYRYALFFIALSEVQRRRYEVALDILGQLDPEARSPDGNGLRGYIYAVRERATPASRPSIRQPSTWDWESRTVRSTSCGTRTGMATGRYACSRWSPLFASLHSEPRFQELLDRIGLGG